MAEEHIETIRRGIEAFNRRDIETMLEMVAPEVEWRPPAQLPGAGVYHGPDGVRQSVADLLEAFGDLRAEPERFIDAGDRVIGLYWWRGRGSASGISVDAFDVPVGVIATMNALGKATDVRFFTTWEEALEIAGVE